MSQPVVTLNIPFDMLVNAVATLSVKEKAVLLEMLEEQLWEEDGDQPNAEEDAIVAQSRADYEAGDYMNYRDFVAIQTKPTE